LQASLCSPFLFTKEPLPRARVVESLICSGVNSLLVTTLHLTPSFRPLLLRLHPRYQFPRCCCYPVKHLRPLVAAVRVVIPKLPVAIVQRVAPEHRPSHLSWQFPNSLRRRRLQLLVQIGSWRQTPRSYRTQNTPMQRDSARNPTPEVSELPPSHLVKRASHVG